MLARKIIVAVLVLGAAGVVLAAQPEGGREVHRFEHRGPGPGRFSVEHVAMHNIMAELLSSKTGKTPDEIRAMFEKGNPHEAFEQLGLKEEDIKPLFKQARQTLIKRAAAAGLITAKQAEDLASAKFEMHMHHMPPPPAPPAVPGVPDVPEPDEGR